MLPCPLAAAQSYEAVMRYSNAALAPEELEQCCLAP